MRAVVSTVLGVILITSQIFGMQYYVSPTGSDETGNGSRLAPWRTIQYGVDSSLPCDTLFVLGDNSRETDDYVENVIIDKQVSLIGIKSDSVLPQLKGKNFQTAIAVYADQVAIKNMNVWGALEENSPIMHLYKVRYCTVNNIIFGVSTEKKSHGGLRLFNSHSNLIFDNTFSHHAWSINLVQSNNNFIRDNKCKESILHGIRVSDSKGNIFSNNICSDNKEHGIFLNSKSKKNYILGNNLSNNQIGLGVYGEGCEDNVFFNNIIENNNYAFRIWESNNNRLFLNYLIDNQQVVWQTRGENHFDSKIALNNKKIFNYAKIGDNSWQTIYDPEKSTHSEIFESLHLPQINRFFGGVFLERQNNGFKVEWNNSGMTRQSPRRLAISRLGLNGNYILLDTLEINSSKFIPYRFGNLSEIIKISLIDTSNRSSELAQFYHITTGHSQFNSVDNLQSNSDINTNLSGGWFDYDNDFDDDLFVSVYFQETDVLFYENDENNSLILLPSEKVPTYYNSSKALAIGDFNNDSYADLFIGNGDRLGVNPKSILLQNIKGQLESVVPPFLPQLKHDFISCSWIDCYNDGFVDLFLLDSKGNCLLLENSEGEFSKKTNLLKGFNRECSSSTWSDVDQDGDLDLLIASPNAGGLLFINMGNQRFAPYYDIPSLSDEKNVSAINSSDFNNDGLIDLFFTKGNHQKNSVLLGTDSSYISVHYGDAVQDKDNSSASVWLDWNNDGLQDLFVANALAKNKTYFNSGHNLSRINFENDSGNANSACCIVSDYDNDGHVDIFVANDSNFNNELLQNIGSDNNWLKVKLIGTACNSLAIGAKVRAKASIFQNDSWQLREVQSMSGNKGQNSFTQHFGLGNAEQVDSLQIEWPSGNLQYLTNIEHKQTLTVKEENNFLLDKSVDELTFSWHLVTSDRFTESVENDKRIDSVLDDDRWQRLENCLVSPNDIVPFRISGWLKKNNPNINTDYLLFITYDLIGEIIDYSVTIVNAQNGSQRKFYNTHRYSTFLTSELAKLKQKTTEIIRNEHDR